MQARQTNRHSARSVYPIEYPVNLAVLANVFDAASPQRPFFEMVQLIDCRIPYKGGLDVNAPRTTVKGSICSKVDDIDVSLYL